jgi:hypothetical protein
MKKLPYHSALKNGTIEQSQPVQRFVYKNSVAFAYDIFDPLPNDFNACDFFYMEPPYPAGVKVFDDRVGISGRSYTDLAARISQFIDLTNKPIVMPMSKTVIKHYPKPMQAFETDFTHSVKGLKTMVYAWNIELKEYKTTEDVLIGLLNTHNCVGDLFCGYGNTAQIAINQNKDFVVSDYNPYCIGFISTLLGAK